MNNELASIDRTARAAVFACHAHMGQFRDDGKTPYSVHLFRVADYLRTLAAERDEAVLCAAYLHDTIEDTIHTYDTIADAFGSDVASLVVEVTNDKRLPKAQCRAAMLEHIPTISTRAKRIKLCDRLDNVTDLTRNGSVPKQSKCERYMRETELILKACEGACPALETALNSALDGLKKYHAQTYL